MKESIYTEATAAKDTTLLFDKEHDTKIKLLPVPSSMRDSRTPSQLEHTLKPTISSDSMVFLSKPLRIVPTQVPKPIVQTAFYLHQQKQQVVTTNLKSCLRGPPFITTEQRNQRAEAQIQQQKEQAPPNVIVFINNTNRQKRRPSTCSQLTMDEEIKISHHDIDNDDDDDDDELSCASLDIQDVFTETRNEFSKIRGKGNSSNSIVSSSSCVTSSNSTENYNSSQRYAKRPIEEAETKRATERKVQMHSKLHKSAQSVFSKRSNTSAKLRWLQYEKESGISDDDDADDEEESNESDYEDFAQDSLLFRNTQNHHRYAQKEIQLDNALVQCNKNLNDTKKEVATAATIGDGAQKVSMCNSYKDLPSSYHNKIRMSRAA